MPGPSPDRLNQNLFEWGLGSQIRSFSRVSGTETTELEELGAPGPETSSLAALSLGEV